MARLSIRTQEEINSLYSIPRLEDEERSFLFTLDVILNDPPYGTERSKGATNLAN